MAAIKVLVIGANLANIDEIKNVVVNTIGGGAQIMTATVDDYKEAAEADLYVCLINRKQEVESIFGAEKVVALTLVPPTEYFIQISRIPAGSQVIIFNNSTAGTQVLLELLTRYHLLHAQYEVVPYDEWDYARVAAKVAAAKYIIGGVAYVGEGNKLQTDFGTLLSKDAVILVSPQRTATPESVSQLCHVFSTLYHRTIMDELKRLSSLDYLTEIANRRTFDEFLAMEYSRAKRDGNPLSLAMIDIDCFKNYNDLYGHSAGDECLKRIAQVLRSVMRRATDFCARYGGEEFAIVLPNTDIDGARHVLEEFRTEVMALMISHKCSTIAPVVTVSAGIASVIRPQGIKVEDLLKRADQALYQAKRRGRNRVVLFAEPDRPADGDDTARDGRE
ncbi:MAG: GGDEF domain-containing protein [Negativicutes bacterium]|nr:GGDEF domain-containing protein [Negativicutes bacterium]